jgi:hypothetical protein
LILVFGLIFCPDKVVQGNTMARLARLNIADIPQHIVQRGN